MEPEESQSVKREKSLKVSGFKCIFCWNVHPAKIGEDFEFDSYFSGGLKPPTRIRLNIATYLNQLNHLDTPGTYHIFSLFPGKGTFQVDDFPEIPVWWDMLCNNIVSWRVYLPT